MATKVIGRTSTGSLYHPAHWTETAQHGAQSFQHLIVVGEDLTVQEFVDRILENYSDENPRTNEVVNALLQSEPQVPTLRMARMMFDVLEKKYL